MTNIIFCSAYKLVVSNQKREDSSDLIFNSSNFHWYDYNNAKEQGLPYYVTAEFNGNESLPEKFVVGDTEVRRGYYNAPLISGMNYQFHVLILSATKDVSITNAFSP